MWAKTAVAILTLCLLGLAPGVQSIGALAQDQPSAPGAEANPSDDQGTSPDELIPPEIPQPDDAAKEASSQPQPTSYRFKIAVVGEVVKELQATTGVRKQIKTPLVLYDPNDGQGKYYAENFPARIVAVSPNSVWMIGVVPSSSVPNTSGSKYKEAAVALNLTGGEPLTLEEFSLHSKFQAVFDPTDPDTIYYCVNEPGDVNPIVKLNLKALELITAKKEDKAIRVKVPAEGNRFYLYTMKLTRPNGLWVDDPANTGDSPVLSLLGLDQGEVLTHVEFPGCTHVIARDDGLELLATVEKSADASIGWYDLEENTFHQVPKLVLTKPTFRWTRNSLAVVAKESTVTRDRFLWIDLASGAVRELYSGYFKVSLWDLSPEDDALVFLTGSGQEQVLFVVPLDPTVTTINRITIRDMAGISWLGCLAPPVQGGGSWLDRLLPF